MHVDYEHKNRIIGFNKTECFNVCIHVTILTSCKHAVIIQCHLYPQDCNSHFNGTADILTARSSLLSTDTNAYYKIKIKKHQHII